MAAYWVALMVVSMAMSLAACLVVSRVGRLVGKTAQNLAVCWADQMVESLVVK